MGRRGPKPGSGGRPKKPLADKITAGNPGKRSLSVIDLGDRAAELEGQAMPKPAQLLSAISEGEDCVTEFDPKLWTDTIDTATVSRDGRLVFKFINGAEFEA